MALLDERLEHLISKVRVDHRRVDGQVPRSLPDNREVVACSDPSRDARVSQVVRPDVLRSPTLSVASLNEWSRSPIRVPAL